MIPGELLRFAFFHHSLLMGPEQGKVHNFIFNDAYTIFLKRETCPFDYTCSKNVLKQTLGPNLYD